MSISNIPDIRNIRNNRIKIRFAEKYTDIFLIDLIVNVFISLKTEQFFCNLPIFKKTYL